MCRACITRLREDISISVTTFVDDVSRHCHKFTVEMGILKNYEPISKIGLAQNVSLTINQDIGGSRGRRIKIEYHLNVHIISGGSKANPSGPV